MFKRKKTSKDNQIFTFSKKWVNRLMWFSCIWMTWSYVLASFDKINIAESLSQTVATVIISTLITYSAKAFWETYSEKKNELKIKEIMLSLGKDLDDYVDDIDDEYMED